MVCSKLKQFKDKDSIILFKRSDTKGAANLKQDICLYFKVMDRTPNRSEMYLLKREKKIVLSIFMEPNNIYVEPAIREIYEKIRNNVPGGFKVEDVLKCHRMLSKYEIKKITQWPNSKLMWSEIVEVPAIFTKINITNKISNKIETDILQNVSSKVAEGIVATLPLLDEKYEKTLDS
ncbi:hypothetical protein KY333_05150 [Candidatus Woesearchaeota archaeon]|nr:hypothetical protein [Candidatus Woesearchaeota archaeon]